MPERKETKSQRIERLKRSKNAWDHLDEIREFARLGFDSIPPEWLSTYFRTWGVYTQGDGAGVTGGSRRRPRRSLLHAAYSRSQWPAHLHATPHHRRSLR